MSRVGDAPWVERLKPTLLHAGVKSASNQLQHAITQLGYITLDLAAPRYKERVLCLDALLQLRGARYAMAIASKAMRHTERHLAQVVGRELALSQLDQIRAIVAEARFDDGEARRKIASVLNDAYAVESDP